MAKARQLEEAMITAVQTIVDAQKNLYDRTIQATVVGFKDDEDKAIGKIKLKYQDSIMYAYITDLNTVDSYIKGENVYVNIPNNDMSQEKTIIGLVKKVGEMSLIDSESMYYLQDEINFATQAEKVFEISANAPSIQIIEETDENYEAFSARLAQRTSQDIRIKADFFIDIDYNPELPQTYALEILYEGKFKQSSGSQEGRIQFTIDDIEGNPYSLGSENNYETQSVVISLPVLQEGESPLNQISIQSIIFKGENLVQGDILKIKNIEIQPVTLYNTDENSGVYLRIGANKTVFSENSLDTDPIILKGALKKLGVPQNLSEIDCYWFRYDGITSTVDKYYDSRGGYGWRFLGEVSEENTEDEEGQQQIVYEALPMPYSYTVKKNGFIEELRTYKLVLDFEGQRLSAEIELKNNAKDFEVSISQLEENRDVYIAEIKNSIEEVDLDKVTYQWYYVDASGNHYQKEAEGSAPNQLFFDIDEILGSGKLYCDFLYEIDGVSYFVGSAFAEIKGGRTEDLSISINGGEQVFLYEDKDGDNAPNLSNESKYFTAPSPLSVEVLTNQNGEMQKEQDVICYWLIPKSDTLLRYSGEETSLEKGASLEALLESINSDGKIQISEDSIDNWTVVKTSTLYFSIAKRYSSEHLYDNIFVAVVNKNNRYLGIMRTNFAFAQEGEEGTGNNGVYVRIVPNSIAGLYMPPYGIHYYNTKERKWSINYDLNGKAFDVSDSNQLVKLQIWKQNAKIFEGVSLSKEITALKWEPLSKNSAFEIDSTNKILFYPEKISEECQWLKATVFYGGIQYQCYYPFIIAQGNGKASGVMIEDGMRNILSIIPYDINSKVQVASVTYNQVLLNSAKSQYSSEKSISNYYTKVNNSNTFKFLEYYQNNAYSDTIAFSIESEAIWLPLYLTLKGASGIEITSWNGKSVDIIQDDGEIFAQHYIAGEKKNNKLNGIIAGYYDVSQNGYATYSDGHRTSYIDAGSGSAVFGETPIEQVVIEPKNGEAIVRSAIYEDSTSGLKVNFSKPSIEYGNQDFSIDKEGQIVSNDWKIDKQQIYSGTVIGLSSNNEVHLDDDEGKSSNQKQINEFEIKHWASEDGEKIAAALWLKKDNQIQSLVSYDGAFIGKDIEIKDTENISYIASLVSSKAIQPLLAKTATNLRNGLKIGGIKYSYLEGEEEKSQSIISLYSKNASQSEALVFNPIHFHFGDRDAFEINREGVARFSKITFPDLNDNNGAGWNITKGKLFVGKEPTGTELNKTGAFFGQTSGGGYNFSISNEEQSGCLFQGDGTARITNKFLISKSEDPVSLGNSYVQLSPSAFEIKNNDKTLCSFSNSLAWVNSDELQIKDKIKIREHEISGETGSGLHLTARDGVWIHGGSRNSNDTGSISLNDRGIQMYDRVNPLLNQTIQYLGQNGHYYNLDIKDGLVRFRSNADAGGAVGYNGSIWYTGSDGDKVELHVSGGIITGYTSHG